MKIILLYLPVFHEGYVNLLKKHEDAKEVWVLGDWVTEEFKEVKKDIRRLSPELAVKMGRAVLPEARWEIIKNEELKIKPKAKRQKPEVVVPHDELMEQIVAKYLPEAEVSYEPIFLRWDRHNALAQNNPEVKQVISKDEFDKNIMKQAFLTAFKSSDWWRQIGAVLVHNGEVQLLAYNKHLPTEHAPYFYNDVRSLFSRGQYFELVSSIHAEASLIAEAAKRGLATEGMSMYVTTFPCPVCAKQVAASGIKKLYYSGGYSLLDGEEVLKSAGVELIRVELEEKEMKKLEKVAEERSILKKYEK